MDDRTLPEGWRWERFGDVVRQVKSTAKDPAALGLTRLVGLEHIDSESLSLRRWTELAELPDGTSFTRVFRAGQVLFGKRRAYQRKVAVPDFDGVCSGDILVFEPSSPDLRAGFLPYVVQSDAFLAHALGTSAGSLSPRTKWQELAKYEFPLPPVEYQVQACDILDAASRLVDAYADAAEALQAETEALAHAVAGEAAAVGWMTAVVDLVEPDRPVTYGILKPGSGYPGGVPVVKVKDFPHGRIELDDLLRTSPEIDNAYKRSRLRAGDLLISIRGTVGRVAEVPPALDGANITQDTARLSIRAEHEPRYIRHMLVTRDVQQQIESRITGLAVKGINIGALRQVKIPTPPLPRQKELAGEFEAIDSAMEQARRAIACARDVRTGLREHLLGGG